MVVPNVVEELRCVAESISAAADEIRKQDHDEERVDCLNDCLDTLSDSIDELASAIRYATNNLLDDRYHPEVAAVVRSAIGATGTCEQNASEEVGAEVAGGAADLEEVPDAVRNAIERHVRELRSQGEQHQRVADYGSVTEMQWWENAGPGVLESNRRLAELRELGHKNGVDIQPLIEGLGGIPESMLIDEVPDLASEPAFPERSAKQTRLFEDQDFTRSL